MSKPLEREEMLTFVRQRLQEVELESTELEGIDTQNKIFQLGRRWGLETAYHDCEHMLTGAYGDNWIPQEGEEDDDDAGTRREDDNTINRCYQSPG